MSLPTIKIGDIVTIDGDAFEVTGHKPPYYWLKEDTGKNSYFYMCVKEQLEMERLYSIGKLVLGRVDKEVGGNSSHMHNWARYTGLNKVVDVCWCGSEKRVNWRDCGDKKSKT